MRETTFNVTRGGNKEVAVQKFTPLCPLVLPVNVSRWQVERVGENEGALEKEQ